MDGSSSSKPKESNQPSQSQERGGQKEQAPGDPQQQPGGQPKDQPGQGETPKGNKDNPEPTPAEVAKANPDDPTDDPLMVSTDREQWGNLPVHMQELFRAEGGDKMPARYRDWIESYYRRLNDR